MKSGIYKITSPSGKIYVGQSVNIRHRIGQYKRLRNCHEQARLYNSFLKYGVDAHSFEVLEYCSIDLLNERELFYMTEFSCRDSGLNIRHGGSNGALSEETKLKISQANKGKKHSAETKKKMSDIQKANPVNYWLGKKRSADDIKKFSDSHIGMVNSNKPIIQYDLSMVEIARFDGATDAFRKTGIKRTAIKNNLIGLSKTCNKTIFKYVSSY
jgi:group I intron endonuclease